VTSEERLGVVFHIFGFGVSATSERRAVSAETLFEATEGHRSAMLRYRRSDAKKGRP
jgi:hypothetical protein